MTTDEILNLYEWIRDTILVWLIPSLFAALTKISYSMKLGKKITLIYILTTISIASFVGYYVDMICVNNEITTWRGAIVAMSALSSDTIIKILMQREFVLAFISKVTGLKIDKKEGNNDLP